MTAYVLPAILALIGSSYAQTNSSESSGVVSYELERKPLPRSAAGFSIGPVSIIDIVKTELTAKVLNVLGEISGAPVPVRVGGSASDKVTVAADLTGPYLLDPEAQFLDTLFISKQYFNLWKDYFPIGTSFTYTLNFANTENNWGNATTQAQWAIDTLGRSLELFELGDSPDHYAYMAYRNGSTWGAHEYVKEFINATRAITSSNFYRNATYHPSFQAGGFADPPDLEDQQWENDDLDIVNITRAGLNTSGLIEAYSVHLFPEADTPPIRKAQISLDLLSNHDVIYQNISQYRKEASAAAAHNVPLIFSAAGSVAGGASGVSDTFGAALWGVDFVLTAAALGISQTFLHFDGYSSDSPIVPVNYTYRAQNLSSGVRSNFYSNAFLAHVVKGPYDLAISALPDFNSSTVSGFALFDDATETGLQKLAFIDLEVYNTTSDLWNSASLSRSNQTAPYGNNSRGTTELSVSTPWKEGTQLNAIRLQGPGTNARSGVTISGQSFDPRTGDLIGSAQNETLTVGASGALKINLNKAEAVVLERVNTLTVSGTNSTLYSDKDEQVSATSSATGKKDKKKKKKKEKKNGAAINSLSNAAILLAVGFMVL